MYMVHVLVMVGGALISTSINYSHNRRYFMNSEFKTTNPDIKDFKRIVVLDYNSYVFFLRIFQNVEYIPNREKLIKDFEMSSDTLYIVDSVFEKYWNTEGKTSEASKHNAMWFGGPFEKIVLESPMLADKIDLTDASVSDRNNLSWIVDKLDKVFGDCYSDYEDDHLRVVLHGCFINDCIRCNYGPLQDCKCMQCSLQQSAFKPRAVLGESKYRSLIDLLDSKYVRSDIVDTYDEVINRVKTGNADVILVEPFDELEPLAADDPFQGLDALEELETFGELKNFDEPEITNEFESVDEINFPDYLKSASESNN